MDALPVNERRKQAEAYDFRKIHPAARFGTASDRYAGWIGQVYSERYVTRVSSRKRTLRGKAYEEQTVPVDSVREYFEHFSVLELDFTFYRPLLDADGEPSSTYFVVQKYADFAPEEARFILKAPQAYFARKLRRSSGAKTHYIDNPDFLNADDYGTRFLTPARDILGERLAGVLFQQEYQRVSDSPEPEENVRELDGFFSKLPDAVQAHLELRSEHLLTPGYFDWLEECGLGHVFSHWTWLPMIREQWRMCGEHFTAANGEAVTRLLTPRSMQYAEAYDLAHPFDKPVEALAKTKGARDMVLDVTALLYQAARQGATLNVIANNRAWGNSPALAQTIAHRVLDEEERRAAGD